MDEAGIFSPDCRVELIDGEIFALSPINLRHSGVVNRQRKLPLYARRGVSEAWIVNRRADVIEVFRDPSPQGYREQFQRIRGEELAPAAFPDLRLSVDDVLGPPASSSTNGPPARRRR